MWRSRVRASGKKAPTRAVKTGGIEKKCRHGLSHPLTFAYQLCDIGGFHFVLVPRRLVMLGIAPKNAPPQAWPQTRRIGLVP